MMFDLLASEKAANVATVLATLVGASGLLAVLCQLHASGKETKRITRIANGEFLLKLEEASKDHLEVRMKFFDGGEWAKPNGGPTTREETIAFEDYLGFFEHCEVLIASEALDENHFFDLFGYLIDDLENNRDLVVKKIVSDGQDYWTLLLRLQKRWAKRTGNETWLL